jgi:hypothetical protein
MGGGFTRGFNMDSEVWPKMHPLVSAAESAEGLNQSAAISRTDKIAGTRFINGQGKRIEHLNSISVVPSVIPEVPGI